MSRHFVVHVSYEIEMILNRLSDEELSRCFTSDGQPMTGEEAREYLKGLQDKGQTSVCTSCPNMTPEGQCGCSREAL